MAGDCCERAVEGCEGPLEEAEGFHGCELMWFWRDFVAYIWCSRLKIMPLPLDAVLMLKN